MTAQPHDSHLRRCTSAREEPAALVVPEDRDASDAGLKAVLDEVGVSLDLGAPNAFAHRWWISACDSAKDPEGRRRMHAQAGRALAGDPVPQGRPWREMGRLAGGAVLCTGARDAS